jgi:hypothetical protein
MTLSKNKEEKFDLSPPNFYKNQIGVFDDKILLLK